VLIGFGEEKNHLHKMCMILFYLSFRLSIAATPRCSVAYEEIRTQISIGDLPFFEYLHYTRESDVISKHIRFMRLKQHRYVM